MLGGTRPHYGWALPDPTDAVPYLLEAVRLARRELQGSVPLIGFAGAPLTLVSYLVEGGHSRTYSQLKRLIFAEPAAAGGPSGPGPPADDPGL